MASGAAMAIATCGMYWPKKLCNCSTPSTIDSMTPPVRSAPNQAGPERDDLVVQPAAQRLLDAHGGAVRHHGALVLQAGAHEHHGRHGSRQKD